MRTATRNGRWPALLLLLAFFATTAHAQATRTVTLTLNTATIADTTRTDSFIEVRGAVEGVAPITLADGNVISWDDQSTLEPENIGGDYWRIQFEIADTTDLTFKFYSQQAEDGGLNGWEADPNPNIPPGASDTTLTVHYFEAQSEYRGEFGDRGEYDWRPYEEKEDSIAVWFRVAMFGEESDFDGYDPAADPPDQQVGVRGDNLDINGDGSVTGPLDWGVTELTLERESTDDNVPGYNVYSGVAYYPMDLVGQTQNYKFVLDNSDLTDGDVDFEEGNLEGNRTFTLPDRDTTLHWVYYGNTAPVATDPVQSGVIFSVDLSPLEAIGVFDVARGDTLEVRGDFNGWDCDNPDDCLLLREPGSARFEQVIAITSIPNSERNYKFFLNFNDENFRDAFGVEVVPQGWEEPLSTTGANRTFIFEGLEGDFQDLGVKRFNDVLPGNIVPDGVSIDVTFSVDMTAALDASEPFDPATDSVTVQVEDPIWLITQGIALPEGGGFTRVPDFEMTDDDGDLVYEGTLTITGPTYAALQYKYAYGTDGTFSLEEGGSTSGLGRRRLRFITPNADGSWPASWEFEQEAYQPTGNLPFETNPVATGIEVVDDEVPSRITLGQNYPNPFNPSTTFEYTLDQTQHVTVRVYDVLGRVVATLADGVQPASTYKVTFDAADLASGVYFYRLETPTTKITRRMLLVK